MSEECKNIDKTLCGGTFEIGPSEVTIGTYNPLRIGGWGPGEGDTHSDTELKPCCLSED
jgi:hypothetical protein